MDEPRIGRTGGEIAELLVQWQSTGDEHQLEVLLRAVAPIVEHVAARSLRVERVADPSAVDDCVSLVYDHLRRLPGAASGERTVERFRPSTRATACGAAGLPRPSVDAGIAFVRWLTRERARDVARASRRRFRRAMPFSQLDMADVVRLRCRIEAPEPDATAAEKMRSAIARLDTRARSVLQRLLDGESQTAIAREIGVCEGTVSRIRARAIAQVRRELAADEPLPEAPADHA